MITERAKSLFEKAAATTMDRLRRDREFASDRVKPVLAFLEEHLFDPNIDAEQVKNACGIRDHNFTTLCRSELGLPLAAYIRELRMETAARLLCDTNLRVHEVAELLGYRDPRRFHSTFRGWCNAKPTAFRRKQPLRLRFADAQVLNPVLRDALGQRSEIMARALDGGLKGEEADSIGKRTFRDLPLDPQSGGVSFAGSGGSCTSSGRKRRRGIHQRCSSLEQFLSPGSHDPRPATRRAAVGANQEASGSGTAQSSPSPWSVQDSSAVCVVATAVSRSRARQSPAWGGDRGTGH